jgi:hypothetical protein
MSLTWKVFLPAALAFLLLVFTFSYFINTYRAVV